jgi:serine/threonine protein kinase
MDLVTQIIVGIVGHVVTEAASPAVDWIKNTIHEAFGGKPNSEVGKALEQIGKLSEADIRRRVSELAKQRNLTAEQIEELNILLINLSRGLHFHSTQGASPSSFVRSERLLELLLQNIWPKRRVGEPVSNQHTAWELRRFLGMGSFGEVWAAKNEHYPETRAFKFFTSPDARKWISDEQQTLYEVRAELHDDPNIVAFLDIAIDATPFPYLELELAEHGSLEDWIVSHEKDRVPLDKLRLIEGIVRGASHAHAKGIFHRDIKPANILLKGKTTDIQPKIADFGLGKLARPRLDSSGSHSSSRSDAGVVGTGIYLPPEASLSFVKREPAQDDVFAIGVVWYQVLVEKLERPPYDFADQLRARSVDQATIRTIERCLANPSKRFKDACDLAQHLPPSIPAWTPPPGRFDVQHLALAFINSKKVPVG